MPRVPRPNSLSFPKRPILFQGCFLPHSKVLAPQTYAALVAVGRPRGRPKADETKVFTALRLDADVLETFKATGKGWQTRVNAALRQFITEHPLGR